MSGDEGKDPHEHDLVMPGFRFHPTEEELIEFYLRRKVQGKRFNVELINFLDLYRYDPWELPALATIGEKEWFFYVPRDRKYRNGDRPNRVTTSGYWKATGADRTIQSESSRSIGLKKTLVFYSGKAPKGIRTSWIMNEYRLPQSETDQLQTAEISLCRVYKRPGIEDQWQLAGTASSKPSCSKGTGSLKLATSTNRPTSNFQTLGANSSSSEIEKMHHVMRGNNISDMCMPVLNRHNIEADRTPMHHSKNSGDLVSSTSSFPTSNTDSVATTAMNDPNRSYIHQPTQLVHPLSSQTDQCLHLNAPIISDKLWEWNLLLEAEMDYTSLK